MYSPLNIVNMYDQLVKTDQKYINYQKLFKEKYKLTSDITNLIDLISIEDIIAYKIERSLNSFNGRMLFPLKSIYLNLFDIAYHNVIDSYEDTKLRKLIRHTFNGKNHTPAYKAKKEIERIEALKNA